MSGLEEGRLLAYLDGELDGAGTADVEAWLEESAEARTSLEEVERRRGVVAVAVGALEPPVPDTAAVRARVRRLAGERRAREAGNSRSRTRLARAAVAVLLLGAAGAAAAVPGSPVREWLESVLTDEPVPAAATAREEASPAAAALGDMGLRVRPVDGRLEIELSGVPADRDVVVRLVDGAHGAVYARRAAFTSGEGRIDAVMRPGDTGPVRVEIPRGAAVASLRVDGRVWLEKRGERLDFPGPTARVSADSIRFGDGG